MTRQQLEHQHQLEVLREEHKHQFGKLMFGAVIVTSLVIYTGSEVSRAVRYLKSEPVPLVTLNLSESKAAYASPQRINSYPPIPLAEWLKAYDLEISDKLASAPMLVTIRDPSDMSHENLMGMNLDGTTIELSPKLVAHKAGMQGVLAHEIAHRYCGVHNDRYAAEWTACAKALGVPEDFAYPAIYNPAKYDLSDPSEDISEPILISEVPSIVENTDERPAK